MIMEWSTKNMGMQQLLSNTSLHPSSHMLTMIDDQTKEGSGKSLEMMYINPYLSSLSSNGHARQIPWTQLYEKGKK